MPATQTIRKKLDYLVRATGRAEADIMAEALKEGVDDLYSKQIAEAYLAGNLERRKAVAELGRAVVEDLDYARSAVEADVEWGLKSA
jgi:predicted DNA-binding protein